MANPKFLNVEKKVPYNLRLPQNLIDKLNAYADITGNTTTNIINKALSDFMKDKTVDNTYLDDIGGVSIKIPYAINQKKSIINSRDSLENLNDDDYGLGTYRETYFAESFVVKRIPNNLDTISGDSYSANKHGLIYNHNALHHGIEFFIYPGIIEVLLTDDLPMINSLYCLYFEFDAGDNVNTYLIDYLTAINLLSKSGNELYKNLLISCVSELNKLDETFNDYLDALNDETDDVIYDDFEDEKQNVLKIYKPLLESGLNEIADKYNSGDIVRIGDDTNTIIFDSIKFYPEIDIDAIISDAVNDDIIESAIKETIGADIEHIVKKVILKLDAENKLETIKTVNGAESNDG